MSFNMIDSPLILRMKRPYLIKGGLRRQGGSNLKSIFNLIITSYLPALFLIA